MTVINFNDLSGGTVVDNEYNAQGVTVSASGGSGQAMIFDTSNPTGGDHDLETTNLGSALIISEDGDSSDPDDNAGGGTLSFAFDDETSVESLTFLDNEEGATVKFYDEHGNFISEQWVDGTNNNAQDVVHFNVDGVYRMDVHLCGSGAIDNLVFDSASSALDGTVEGTSGDDVIDADYAGDPDGDFVDNNDAILPGDVENDDLIVAGAGNDFVLAGAGDDEVYGGSGDDTLCGQDGDDTLFGEAGNDILEGMNDDDVLFGGAGDDRLMGDAGNDMLNGGSGDDSITGGTGDDVIYGDANGEDETVAAIRESFSWEGLSDSEIDHGIVVDTGSVTVTYDRTQDTGAHNSSLSDVDLNVDGIDSGDQTVDTNSSLYSETDGQGNEGAFSWDFSEPVDNVSFNINDIDGDGVVRVTAFDAAGNPIEVVLTGGNGLTLLDTDTVAGADTADSEGGYADADTPNYNLNVSIPGPVSRIVVEHDQDGSNNSGINITEIFFDSTDGATGGDGVDGNDVIAGGTGEDLIYGGGGDDTITGGADDDTVYGGTGDDDIDGGTGNDFLLGGDGNDNIEGGTGDDTLCGQDGDDTLFGGAGNDILEGMNDNDVLFGGAGDDRIYGDAGNDVIEGGAGADQIYAGSDRDVILGGAGDTVDGGAGGDDYDILDLTGQGTFILTGPDGTGSPIPDSNGNGIDGQVVFVDADGVPTGETISFTEIEEIIGDEANQGPDATDDAFVGDEDTPTAPIGNVITGNTGNGADTDPNGDTLIVSAVDGADGNVGTPVEGSDGGLITILEDGTVSFDPNGDFEVLGDGETATTTVTYTVDDGNGGTDTASVTITVNGTNDGPVATDNGYFVSQDEAAGDVDANAITDDTGAGVDSDPEDDALTVVGVDGDAANVGGEVAGDNGGLFTINADGSVDFDANGEFDELGDGDTASTTVTYTIADEDGLEDTATVTFTVTGTNDGPTAVANTGDATEDAPVVLENVLLNDTDPDGDTLTVAAVDGDPANVGQPVDGSEGGTFTIGEDGTATFDPDGDFEALGEGETATTEVTYTVTDPSGATSSTTVTVTVTGVNDAPNAVDNAYTATPTETAGDVDGNVITDDTGAGLDSDPEGDNLTVSAVAGNAANVGSAVIGDNGGLFTINADGTVDFDANGDFDNLGLGATQDTSVTYTIVDENGAEDTATATFTVSGINDGTVQGTGGNDIINPDIPYVDADGDIVDANDAILPGDVGNDDVIMGFGGDDSINAGEGNDIVFGGTGNDTIEGGTGNDQLMGNEGDDVVSGGDGDDMIFGAEGDDSLAGNAGNDKIEGSTGDDTIRGGDGDDDLWGGEDDDTVFGGDDNDTVGGGAGDDRLDGGDGDDTVFGDAGNDSISGGIGDDSIDGGTGDDSIDAGTGNDVVEGGDGNDVINTGNHVDPRVDYDYPSIPFGDNDQFPNNDLDTVFGGAGDDIITTGDDDDSIDGGAGNDFIDAGIDDDSVTGGTGNDTIIGGQGEDIIQGNDGDDLIYGGLEDEVLNQPDAIDEAPDDNRDTIYGGDGNDTIFGRDDADTLFGDDGTDLIYGGIDDDSINGGDGDDTLFGDEGDDSITGANGTDTVYGGDGNDFVGGGFGDFGDEVYGDAGEDVVLGGDGDDTLFGGTGNDTIDGGRGDDTVYGDDGDDSIQAGNGDDTLFGGDGNDLIRGNGGSDIIEGNDGDDVIISHSAADQVPDQDYPGDGLAADTDPFNDMDTVFGGAGNDTIRTGDDADVIFGGDGNDNIDGGIDNDTITGGAGEDNIEGGFGSDTIFGGNGGDVVTGGEDPDDSDVDVLDLTGSNVDFITYVDGDPEAGTVTFFDGSTMTFSEIENVIPCFTPGTAIATAKGERLVEELTIGDRIITRDNGIQEIAWVGHKEMSGKQLVQNPHLKPILIKAGALGNGLPERDMMVSPNHRVLVASDLTQLYFEENEVLAAAKHMVGANGIHAVDVMSTTYVHFMFERHEVVLSNGAWTESFQPGDYSLKGIGNSQRNEIMEIFPELATKTGLEGYQSARKALKKHEAKLLLK
ncbi:MAG: Ca2+-binding RTX toxin-like protein [Yoonia sp.]|jgi:Ca2+-binding RTX toxin-like protein